MPLNKTFLNEKVTQIENKLEQKTRTRKYSKSFFLKAKYFYANIIKSKRSVLTY